MPPDGSASGLSLSIFIKVDLLSCGQRTGKSNRSATHKKQTYKTRSHSCRWSPILVHFCLLARPWRSPKVSPGGVCLAPTEATQLFGGGRFKLLCACVGFCLVGELHLTGFLAPCFVGCAGACVLWRSHIDVIWCILSACVVWRAPSKRPSCGSVELFVCVCVSYATNIQMTCVSVSRAGAQKVTPPNRISSFGRDECLPVSSGSNLNHAAQCNELNE